MKDLREGVAELFEEASSPPARASRMVRHRWPLWKKRWVKRVGFKPKAIPPLPFPMSCRFCRRGVHCLGPHVGNCRSAPAWALPRNGGVLLEATTGAREIDFGEVGT